MMTLRDGLLRANGDIDQETYDIYTSANTGIDLYNFTNIPLETISCCGRDLCYLKT
eukprot:m.204244 g.204244  ORF g.204244 m.204244 type:complete len:56 (-) comp16882_c4_seq6:824-991(-)